MFQRRVARVLVLLLAFAANAAYAFFDPPWITPAAPREGETVSVDIRGGACDSIFEHPGYPQITMQGNAIRLLEYGHHWDTTDLCIYPVGVLSVPFGAFPPGDYTLTVDFIYDDYIFGPTVINIGVVSFTVTGAQPAASVPASTLPYIFSLFVAMSAVALAALRTRRRCRY